MVGDSSTLKKIELLSRKVEKGVTLVLSTFHSAISKIIPGDSLDAASRIWWLTSHLQKYAGAT